LSVTDDGVGVPTGADKARPGLGAGIVEALARQMLAVISVTDARPGVSVAIVHDAAASPDREITVAA